MSYFEVCVFLWLIMLHKTHILYLCISDGLTSRLNQSMNRYRMITCWYIIVNIRERNNIIVRNQKKKIERSWLAAWWHACPFLRGLLIRSHLSFFLWHRHILRKQLCRSFVHLELVIIQDEKEENYLWEHNRYMMTRYIIINILFVLLMIDDRVSFHVNLLTTTIRWYHVQFY
jgi:hypothetical protein